MVKLLELIVEKQDTLVFIIVTVLGLFGFGKAWIKAMKKEISEAANKMILTGKKLKEFRSEDSEKGKKLSADEIQIMIGLIADTVIEAVDVIETAKEFKGRNKGFMKNLINTLKKSK